MLFLFYHRQKAVINISPFQNDDQDLGILKKKDQGSIDYTDTRKKPPQMEPNEISSQDWVFNLKPFDQS